LLIKIQNANQTCKQRSRKSLTYHLMGVQSSSEVWLVKIKLPCVTVMILKNISGKR